MPTLSTRSTAPLINPDKLSFSVSRDDDFSPLDFKEDDGSDPLGVDSFIRQKAKLYQKNNLATVYVVRYEKQTVAFFTVSMTSIEARKLAEDDRVEGATFRSYPAMLLGNMGVDRKYRNQGIGRYICEYCIGLAQEENLRVACAVVCLQTSKEKTGYYKDKCKFKHSATQHLEGKVWMYRRII